MSQRELDEAIAKIQSEPVTDEQIKTAAGRVYRNVFDSTYIAAEPTGKLRGCADMRALIPAYVAHTLSSPRALLLEDHVLTCVDCRRALHEARHGAAPAAPIPINRGQRKRVPILVWATAAALLIGIGLGLTGRLPGQNAMRATVVSVQGSLYRVTDIGVSLVEAGKILNNTDELRTAKGSHAILRLAGGSLVEIAERSDVAFSGGGWRTTSLNLQRGQMIVDARNAGSESLNVISGDMTIPIAKSVVAIDHGTKDSHVAVAQGSVQVHQGPDVHTVAAGHLDWGHLRPASLTVSSEFAWSENSAAYRELLSQLSGLQNDLQNLPSPGLRYSSNIPQYLPADTYLYAAVPNLGGTITEAKKLFDSRLAESDVLRQWWQQKAVSQNGQFDRIVDQISALSNYLGDEIVVAVSGDTTGSKAGPVFIAPIKQTGLAEYIQANLPAGAQVQIVTTGAPLSPNKLLIELDNNILVATTSAAQLQRVESVIQTSGAANFTGSPFYARIAKVYQHGAGSFLAANLEQIRAESVSKSTADKTIPAGFDNVQYLVLERNGDGEMRAALSFAGARQGVASWLGAPSPAGSLDFVSPDANFAASLVMKSPRVMMQELLGMVANGNAKFTEQLNDFEAKAGVNLVDDVAAPLGNDLTFAADAGLVPILAVEVYDAAHLQQTLTVLIDRFNQLAPPNAGHLTLATHQVNGVTFYSITSDKANATAAHYTFADGYLVASWSEANVLNAIQNKQTGHTLASSDAFRAKLPADGVSNFSAMVYTNMSALGSLAKQLPGSQKQQAISGFLANSAPGVVCVYGEPDRIVAAAKGSFLGFNLATLIELQEGKSMRSLMASTPIAQAKETIN